MSQIPAPPKTPTYVCATYVEQRRPKWKYHTSMGHAKNAARMHCGWSDVIIYEFKNEELVEKYRVPMRHGRDESPFPWEREPQSQLKEIAQRMRELRESTARAERVIREAAQELAELMEKKEELDRN